MAVNISSSSRTRTRARELEQQTLRQCLQVYELLAYRWLLKFIKKTVTTYTAIQMPIKVYTNGARLLELIETTVKERLKEIVI
uniref:Transposase n=1 Tax=Syphacia muris TaxID=451379 RepID=A0A0N5AIY6_9BILA